MDSEIGSTLIDLVCSQCQGSHAAEVLQTYCHDCNAPLLARYDLEALNKSLSPQTVATRQRGLWRWRELLPVRQARFHITLGEGDTPLLQAGRLGEHLGLHNLYIKEEGRNPTGTFKARGLIMAVAKAMELDVTSFVIPTAGNAGGALAAYAALCNLEAHVFMPRDAPRINQVEVAIHGANLRLVDGLINDAARQAASEAQRGGWFDVSTFKEPYRVEGKKTMGLELAESFGWRLPEVIIYPTGGGTGLVGMWKAFQELEDLGWIGAQRPRMVSVQSDGCAPIVRAFQQGLDRAEPWENADTLAAGLRVPVAFADRLILSALYESQGTAVAVSDQEILASQKTLARMEGVFAAPEGAATLAGLQQLQASGWIDPKERIVLFNTGDGLKYV